MDALFSEYKGVFTNLLKTKNTRKIILTVVVVLTVFALIACIFISMYLNIHSQYNAAKRAAGDELYSKMYMLVDEFERSDNDGAISDEGIASIRTRYENAEAASVLMASAFGSEYALIDSSMAGTVRTALSEYEAAKAAGWPTENSYSTLKNSMSVISGILRTRFDENAHIK